MNAKKIIFYIIPWVIVSTLFITACAKSAQNENNTPITETKFLMGTLIKITIYDKNVDASVFTKAFNRIAEIEKKMTINEPTNKSEIKKLNDLAGHSYAKLSPDTFFVLKKGQEYSALANGSFDITIGPLVKLWNIGKENAQVPDLQKLQERLALVNFQDLVLDEKNLQAKLANRNMQVDLGAIAKGYAADETAKILKKSGVNHGIINLGGNILTLGTKPNGQAWSLGLQDPYEPRGKHMGIVKLKNQALVSSGIYERFFEEKGKQYHHILDPHTGYPAENDLASVSIVSNSSIDADALSTTIFLLGLEQGLAKIERLKGTEALIITKDKKVYTSSGINNDNFAITNSNYQLQN